jgi:hypothetical protein
MAHRCCLAITNSFSKKKRASQSLSFYKVVIGYSLFLEYGTGEKVSPFSIEEENGVLAAHSQFYVVAWRAGLDEGNLSDFYTKEE